MNKYNKIFKNQKKPLIGMVHLLALPGSPNFANDLNAVYIAAKKDLTTLIETGFDAAIIENFSDIPYETKNPLISYTTLTSIVTKLKQEFSIPLGINVQFNDYEAEWAIAYACDVDFIRVECFAENRMGPNGFIEACGPKLTRLKAQFPKDIALFCDVNVKHTFPLVDQPLEFTLNELLESNIDAIICTGMITGASPKIEEVKEIKKIIKDKMPLIIGSGVNDKTLIDYLKVSDAVIIGSSIKEDGIVTKPVEFVRSSQIVKDRNDYFKD